MRWKWGRGERRAKEQREWSKENRRKREEQGEEQKRRESAMNREKDENGREITRRDEMREMMGRESR